ncbi:hypothetical protein GIB67_013820 [Kingdonia uniflora]|uniref:Uncharacterized protein n=1 Tax=Kingdonia uniflora TaxID=39325 RepID=A0A7J7M2M2_9MAGN|nr:hypothetical protein GIB67_013820 [Kingdonia uniflora]
MLIVKNPKLFLNPNFPNLFSLRTNPRSSSSSLQLLSYNLSQFSITALMSTTPKVLQGSEEDSFEISKVRKREQNVLGVDLEEGDSKKFKESIESSSHGKEVELEIAFCRTDVKNKYKDEGLNDSSKIAAFDFDGCLVNTSVKKVGPDAWSLLYPSIPEKLKELYNDGYKLVIFTNESNIERWKNKRQVAIDSKIGRLNNFIKHVNVPIQVFIACGLGKTGAKVDDSFRKPKPGMWRIMQQQFNSGIPVDMDQSFYVGDAAGRKRDHSDADIKFAEAIGLKFYVPEEYFDA